MKRVVGLALVLIVSAHMALAICEDVKRHPHARWAWTTCIAEIYASIFDSGGDGDGISG